MANRPVFISSTTSPYCKQATADFEWNGGFALSQKRKNIRALHEAFLNKRPGLAVLEISSKSESPEGVAASAFNLPKHVPSLDRAVPLECVFQGGKVFENGGPFTDLYDAAPREAKRDPRLKESGRLVAFEFEGRRFPLEPKSAFYDWLYITALAENSELAGALLAYDAFTDIEFNPKKSINCQARAAAEFVGLSRAGMVDQAVDFDALSKLLDWRS